MAAKSNSKPKATKAVEVEPTEVEVNETVTVEKPEVVEASVEEKVEEVVVEDDKTKEIEVVIEEPKVEAGVEEKVEEIVVEDNKTKEIEVVIEEPKVEAASVEKEFTSVDKVIGNKKPVSIGYGYVHTWNGMEY